jgi:3-oxoacyl-[acyl-carrier protein] reductase
MANELIGHVALVTGGGRGFGKAIAKAFAAEGAAVTITARTTRQIDTTVAEIKAAGGKAFAVPGDVTSRKDVERVIVAAHRHFGPATLLVNGASATAPSGALGTIDPDEWWNAQAVHVRGPFLYVSGVLPEMIRARKGRIINVASPGFSALGMGVGIGRAAQLRLTEQLAVEGRLHGISAFAIARDVEDAARLERCAAACVRLASGRYDGLSGRHVTPDDDFDALLAAASSAPN